ncbi:orotidine 5'-phosphate decarboxylase [Neisseria gonorrhoeae]|uniref:Orotidine 5'-phosphate decarboxylase n=1 Tax=Neisseria gonorrhoeae TaxID=485 RepID=A0A378VYN9_NEIGO|nr:orotidine 5'-phosphate decarboxylase [Neisseria gonorrhoeae]
MCQIKIGKELFTATGRSLAESLIHQGFKLFLDLKYHDIPHTVAQACKVAADMGVWMVDMHASGGRRMMEAAAEAVAGYGTKPLLIGVTVLTSMEQSDLAEIGLNTALKNKSSVWQNWHKVRAWTAWSVPPKKPRRCAANWDGILSWLHRVSAWTLPATTTTNAAL